MGGIGSAYEVALIASETMGYYKCDETFPGVAI